MKQFLSMILAGVLGGLITFAAVQYTTTPAEDATPGATRLASFTRSVPPVVERPTPVVPDFNFADAAERATPAVVYIKASASGTPAQENTPADSTNPFRFFFDDDFFRNPFGGEGRRGPRQGSGSGVIYTEDGYIITNNHVVEFADEVEVTLSDNRIYKADVIGTDERTDLAVLKIEADNLPTLQLSDSDKARIGEWVLAVGNPFDLTSTVTAGIISAKGRSIQILGGGDAIEAFIQTDAAVNPGNSGGALVDADGRLLGINTAIASRTGAYAGYSFAIPVNLMKRIVDDIIKYGSFKRAYLGVYITELDSELADELGLNISQGVVVNDLIEGGSAAYAGMEAQDVITKVNGRSVSSVPELQEIIGRARVGETVAITVNRSGRIKDIPVTLRAEE